MLHADVLQPCWRAIRQEAAAGVEQGRAQAYEQPLDDNLHHRVERLKPKRYRAQLVRRPSRPPGDGTPRPLGRPAGEAQRLPRAVARLLAALYAQDCLRSRSGYRPPGGALEAVATRTSKRQCGRYAWVVAADSKPVFDTIEHDGMVRRFAERSEEGALRRLIRTWLHAGGRDTDGQGLHPVTGPPQGGTGSPGLAKVFRHDVRALGCETVVKRPGRGAACLRRSAAACVGAFAAQAEAERFDNVLGRRRETCGLERSGAQTRLIPLSRYRQGGQRRCELLGGACRWGTARQGQAPRKQRTARKQLRSALQRVTAWCQAHRHRRLPVLVQRLNAKLRGYANDSGVHGKAARLQECFTKARRMLFKGLKRRRQRHRATWQGSHKVLERCKVARPRLVGRPKTRQAALKTSADLRKRV